MRQLKIAKQITQRESISLEKYLNEVSSIALLTPQEEVELAKLIKNNEDPDGKALKKLTQANLRFVISVAKQYQNYNGKKQELSDLINAGNEGLITAAKRFDDTRGFKFISYAVWWIRQNILLFLAEHGRGIRIPLNKQGILNKINTASSKLEQKLERVPTSEEIAECINEESITKKIKLNISSQEVEMLQAIGMNASSLDMKIGEDESGSLIDLIKADGMEDVQIMLTRRDLQSTLKRLFEARLSLKEQDVLTSFFGLFDETAKSLEEIGIKHELTRERVRQIKEKAVKKLKFSHSAKLIREYA